jgi:hypothetical protein
MTRRYPLHLLFELIDMERIVKDFLSFVLYTCEMQVWIFGRVNNASWVSSLVRSFD